jgi:hypothetical protein
MSGMVTMQVWTETVANLDLYASRWQKMSASVIKTIVDLVTDYGIQYLDPSSHTPNGEEGSNDQESQFQRSIRTIISQLEHVLTSEFGLARMDIKSGSEPNQQKMSWVDSQRIPAPSRELAGKVAFVAVPGYFALTGEGNTPYKRARVVLYR